MSKFFEEDIFMLWGVRWEEELMRWDIEWDAHIFG